MASIRSKLVILLLSALGQKARVRRSPELAERGLVPHTEPSREMRRRYRIDTRLVQGRAVHTIAPAHAVGSKHIYYLHGGGYIAGFMTQHWEFLGRLVDALGCTVTAPDYPFAPAGHVHDAMAMVLAVYKDVVARVKSANLTLMGDSAGGGMSLALAQQARDHKLAQPRDIVMLCPWLDVTMSNPEIREVEPRDPFLDLTGVIADGRMYAGTTDRRDPRVSPLYGSVRGLGDLSVFTSTRDILNPDARRLKAIAEAEGTPLHHFEYPEMPHMWMLLPIPEAARAFRQIVNIILGR